MRHLIYRRYEIEMLPGEAHTGWIAYSRKG